jgi:hypothetical protein
LQLQREKREENECDVMAGEEEENIEVLLESDPSLLEGM